MNIVGCTDFSERTVLLTFFFFFFKFTDVNRDRVNVIEVGYQNKEHVELRGTTAIFFLIFHHS